MGEQQAAKCGPAEEDHCLENTSSHPHVFPLLIFNKLCVVTWFENLSTHLCPALGTWWWGRGPGVQLSGSNWINQALVCAQVESVMGDFHKNNRPRLLYPSVPCTLLVGCCGMSEVTKMLAQEAGLVSSLQTWACLWQVTLKTPFPGLAWPSSSVTERETNSKQQKVLQTLHP